MLTVCSRVYLSNGRERGGLAGAISTIVEAGVLGELRFGAASKFSTKSRRFSQTAVLSSNAEALIGEVISKCDWPTEFELTTEQN